MSMKILLTAFLIILKIGFINAQQFDPALQKLVKSAYEKNDTIRLNNIRIQQAQIDERITRNNYLPKLTANATYTRLNDDIIFPPDMQSLLLGTQRLLIKEGAGLPFNSTLPPSVSLTPVPPIQEKNIFKITGNTQWLLFSGFKVENGIKAFRHQQNALSYGTQKQQARLLLEIADLYDKLALLYASDSVIRSSDALLDRQQRYVEGAIKNGLATPIERKKIELARQKLQLRIVENEGNRLTLLERLHQLTGEEFDFLNGLRPILLPMILENDTLVQERSEIRSLDEAILASKFKEKAERSEYIPKLAAFAQYEFRKQDLSLLDPRWYAGLRLQWNIFDGFATRDNARRIALERQAYEVQKESVQDLIQLGKAKAQHELKTANQRISMLNAQIALSADSYEFVAKQYNNGLTTMTELLNALNDLEKARFDIQQAYYDQRRSSMQLLDVNGTLLNQF